MSDPPSGARDRLLARAVEHVADTGFREVSLRELAAALGTSHRMLIYHFGSREQLYAEIVRSFETAQRESITALVAGMSGPPDEVMRAVWRVIADPANTAQIRLYFEVFAQALRGGDATADLLDHIVSDWLGPLEALERDRGVASEQARANVRVGVAVTRGLLLDLVATGDREGVDAAFERFLDAVDFG